MPSEPTRKRVLFLFAHQDDEAFCAPRIERELAADHEVTCLYLTDGGKGRADPATRDRETLDVLGALGVATSRVHFLGSRDHVPDGELVEHLDASLRRVEDALGDRPVHRIYCLAYEGGHQDHDASHLVALAVSRRRGLLARTWQIAVYNGHGRPGPLFRVDHPLDLPVRRLDRRLSFRDALRQTLLIARYPSQWRSFLGLFPGHFVARLVSRRESFQAVSLSLVQAPPHPGRLLYERLYGFGYERFRRSAEPFVRRHLAPHEPAPGTEPAARR